MAKKCHNHRLQANQWHREKGAQRRHKMLLLVLLLYVPSQQLWSLRDRQFT